MPFFYAEQDGKHKKFPKCGRLCVREDGGRGALGMGGRKGVQKGVRINSGTVEMGSARRYRETSVTFRRFTMENRQVRAGGGNALNAAIGGNAEGAEKGEEGQDKKDDKVQQPATLQDWQSRLQQGSSKVAVRNSASQTVADIRQTTLRYIFNLLFSYRRDRFGQWMRDDRFSEYQQGVSYASPETGQEAAGTYFGSGSQMGQQPAMTNIRVLTYSSDVLQIEREEASFSTVGTVRTADGREISFNVNVGMSREFQQYYQGRQEEAFVLCDPLVINLDTDVAELSDQTFYFDIDGDGELDEISGMGAGSGYLALDKNGDGVINDGSELFGTASGNGFGDLARYDEDGNGWIDENDAIWDKLKIWCKGENGEDVLYKLSDKGVGAICLQNVSTDFALKGQEGRTKGAVRSTGVFLYENGCAGTVQHVDVAKYQALA